MFHQYVKWEKLSRHKAVFTSPITSAFSSQNCIIKYEHWYYIHHDLSIATLYLKRIQKPFPTYWFLGLIKNPLLRRTVWMAFKYWRVFLTYVLKITENNVEQKSIVCCYFPSIQQLIICPLLKIGNWIGLLAGKLLQSSALQHPFNWVLSKN